MFDRTSVRETAIAGVPTLVTGYGAAIGTAVVDAWGDALWVPAAVVVGMTGWLGAAARQSVVCPPE